MQKSFRPIFRASGDQSFIVSAVLLLPFGVGLVIGVLCGWVHDHALITGLGLLGLATLLFFRTKLGTVLLVPLVVYGALQMEWTPFFKPERRLFFRGAGNIMTLCGMAWLIWLQVRYHIERRGGGSR